MNEILKICVQSYVARNGDIEGIENTLFYNEIKDKNEIYEVIGFPKYLMEEVNDKYSLGLTPFDGYNILMQQSKDKDFIKNSLNINNKMKLEFLTDLFGKNGSMRNKYKYIEDLAIVLKAIGLSSLSYTVSSDRTTINHMGSILMDLSVSDLYRDTDRDYIEQKIISVFNTNVKKAIKTTGETRLVNSTMYYNHNVKPDVYLSSLSKLVVSEISNRSELLGKTNYKTLSKEPIYLYSDDEKYRDFFVKSTLMGITIKELLQLASIDLPDCDLIRAKYGHIVTAYSEVDEGDEELCNVVKISLLKGEFKTSLILDKVIYDNLRVNKRFISEKIEDIEPYLPKVKKK